MRILTYLIAASAVLYGLSANAQTKQVPSVIKSKIRLMDQNYPKEQETNLFDLRADYIPFPDSTITYNIKGESVGKTINKYNGNGDLTSKISYTRSNGVDKWIESERYTAQYDVSGKPITSERTIWDESKKAWIGSYKNLYAYNQSGQETLAEYYEWDAQANYWKGIYKFLTDYETGNQRIVSHQWDANTKSWKTYKRTENISEKVQYEEYWSSDGKWEPPTKREKSTLVNYDKSGLNITISEERLISKDENGNWDDDNPFKTVRYDSYAPYLTSWSAYNFKEYKISNDNMQRIESVNLTGYNGETFRIDFTYDNTINQVKSAVYYKEGNMIDNNQCVFDAQGRVVEVSRNLNYEGMVENSKYAYTYIRDSRETSSTESYLWDSSRKIFVRDSKNMYIHNDAGKTTMYQTYSWAENKWVLSSYTVYYPNAYTSDLEFEETESVGSDNKGAFAVGFNLPIDADVTGSFYITFPQGFVLDEVNTVLSDALSAKYTITITSQGGNTWFIEIKEATTGRSSLYAGSEYKKILTIAYNVDEETVKGDYDAEIKNLNFALSDGTILIEQERKVPITVERSATGNEQINADKIEVAMIGNVLRIDTPAAEYVQVFRINGENVFSVSKPIGEYVTTINGWSNGIYIITGSSGWSTKVLVK